MATATRNYDPGTATTPTKIGPNTWAIDSFRGEEKAYTVTLSAAGATCSCPHYIGRLAGTTGECKHIRQVRATRYAELEQKAKAIPDCQLPILIGRYEGRDPQVAIALLGEAFDRAQAAGREAELKAVFA